MKNAIRKLKVWIIAIILTVIGIGVPFLVLVITLNLENTAAFQYPLLLGAFAASYLLFGFIWGDLYIANIRRKEKNWDGPLPQEVKDAGWSRKLPFYLSALTIFIVFMVFEIIFWITGNYPFL